eukprot:GILJ01012628.1.p1 GENE.GILJ01012628.1~~GILJ01012628.1.p1  ORF type:complete len:232 (+),score=13.30 GILJ01012628.1:563-1258(+)
MVTDASLGIIATVCTSLMSLDVSDCWKLTNAAVEHIQRLQRLQHFFFNSVNFRCENHFAVRTLPFSLPFLETLHISSSAASVEDFLNLNRLRRLCDLNVSSCTNFVDSCLSSLVEIHAASLRSLMCRGCLNISDQGISILFRGCYQLRYLDISETVWITDMSLLDPRAYLPQLIYLNISQNASVSQKAVEGFISKCPQLIAVRIEGCRKLDASEFRTLFPTIRFLDTSVDL